MNELKSRRAGAGLVQKMCVAVVFLALMTIDASVCAQSTSVFAEGLKQPLKIIFTPQGNLLVGEPGDAPNAGRVSIINRNGVRRTLIDGLPAGFVGGAPPDVSGSEGLALRGRTLFIVIGIGDATRSGPVPGSEVPNANPASPLLSSILAFTMSAKTENSTTGFVLTPTEQALVASGTTVDLADANGNQATLKMLVNFPDYVPNFRPDFPANVRGSHPYGVALGANHLYVADAGLNSIIKVDADSGAYATLVSFPPRRNPLPFGPPVYEAVPDSVRLHRGSLLVTLLTGFPFPAGGAEVRKIDTVTGADQLFISGLTAAIDVLPLKALRSADDRFYVLEFSTDFLAQPPVPGRLSLFNSPAGPPVVVSGDLITPTSIARNTRTGELFITETATGRVMRVQVP